MINIFEYDINACADFRLSLLYCILENQEHASMAVNAKKLASRQKSADQRDLFLAKLKALCRINNQGFTGLLMKIQPEMLLD